MNPELTILLLFILGFIIFNFLTEREKSDSNYRSKTLKNIDFVMFTLAFCFDKSYLLILTLILFMIFYYFYDEEKKSDKGIFLYMISAIVLTPMVFLIPDKYHLEFANIFSPNIYMYLILLTSLVYFAMNIYNFKQITTYSKNKLYTFIFLQVIIYIEYFYLVYFFIFR
ncbi:hypothetical protein [Peptoniphilus phoceensis]|uniref:hypothetical protein n=1 Tax=Peptoniphilus phoceensis TaxID=1720298 RepID=UPI00078601B1|nr:hypothetical protein [Peptoniphilus phoceensis]